jgi:hypothetical protein
MIVLKETSGIGISRNGFYESPSAESLQTVVKQYMSS